MSAGLDHVFVCTPAPADAVAELGAAGLDLPVRRTHRGQGTQNACAVFRNAYLEVLWERDEKEIRSETVRPLSLWERVRWRDQRACPFGIALRDVRSEDLSDAWEYRPPYLKEGQCILVLTPAGCAAAPMVFVPPGRGRRGHEARSARSIDTVRVSGPGVGRLSEGTRRLCAAAGVRILEASEWLMAVELSGGGQPHELRSLPLVVIG
jgi:hypothetical protein